MKRKLIKKQRKEQIEKLLDYRQLMFKSGKSIDAVKPAIRLAPKKEINMPELLTLLDLQF